MEKTGKQQMKLTPLGYVTYTAQSYNSQEELQNTKILSCTFWCGTFLSSLCCYLLAMLVLSQYLEKQECVN